MNEKPLEAHPDARTGEDAVPPPAPHEPAADPADSTGSDSELSELSAWSLVRASLRDGAERAWRCSGPSFELRLPPAQYVKISRLRWIAGVAGHIGALIFFGLAVALAKHSAGINSSWVHGSLCVVVGGCVIAVGVVIVLVCPALVEKKVSRWVKSYAASGSEGEAAVRDMLYSQTIVGMKSVMLPLAAAMTPVIITALVAPHSWWQLALWTAGVSAVLWLVVEIPGVGYRNWPAVRLVRDESLTVD